MLERHLKGRKRELNNLQSLKIMQQALHFVILQLKLFDN